MTKKYTLATAGRILLFIGAVVLLSACTGVAPGMKPVSNFDVDRYLGKWYEIARLDHSFERGMNNVSAEYTKREDGGIRVLNRGYSVKNKAWEDAEGKAYFIAGPAVGHLKVSFFGPFYGSYVIAELDQEDYQYAFVTSYNKKYLWLLARDTTVPQAVEDKFMTLARNNGYAVDELIFVEHD